MYLYHNIALILALLLPVAAATSEEKNPPTPQDFAYGLRLVVEPDGAIYGLELPDSIYDGVTRGDLGDLRVFNALGEVLPHTLQRPTAPVAKPPAALAVPFFPLYGNADASAEGVRFSVRIGADGALIELAGGAAAPATRATAPVQAYLLDLSRLPKRPLASLHLRWDSPPDASFVARVDLEVSDDLAHWRGAGSGALADLDFSGQRLQRTSLVPTFWRPYLRLAWPTALAGVSLRQVQVMPVAQDLQGPERQRREVAGIPVSGSPHTFFFDAGGLLPVDRVQVRLPQPNTLLPVEIRSRGDASNDWITRAQDSLYDLSIDGIHLRNEAISLPPLAHRYWRLVAGGEAGGLGAGVPVLELAWIPYRLLFLAHGPTPYLLAYGSGRIGPMTGKQVALLGTLARDPQRVKSAWVAGPSPLSGERARAVPSPPLPWVRILLWAVLLLCVLALAWMARRVYVQLAVSSAPAQDNSDSAGAAPPPQDAGIPQGHP